MFILDGYVYVKSDEIELWDFRAYTSRMTPAGRRQPRFQPYVLMKAGGYDFCIDGMKDVLAFIRCMDPSAKRNHVSSLMKEGGMDPHSERGDITFSFFDIIQDLLFHSDCLLRFSLSFSTDEEKKLWRASKAYRITPKDAVRHSEGSGHYVERKGDFSVCAMIVIEPEQGSFVIGRKMKDGSFLITSLFVTPGDGCFRPERSVVCADMHQHMIERTHRILEIHAYPHTDTEHSLVPECTSKETDDLEFIRYTELFLDSPPVSKKNDSGSVA